MMNDPIARDCGRKLPFSGKAGRLNPIGRPGITCGPCRHSGHCTLTFHINGARRPLADRRTG
jgi:hypothetical protein